jgi:uncharacterized protein (DUF924 family)
MHGDIARKYLTRQLPHLIPGVMEEITDVVQDQWKQNCEDWTEIMLFDTCIRMVARASNRVFVGTPVSEQRVPL